MTKKHKKEDSPPNDKWDIPLKKYRRSSLDSDFTEQIVPDYEDPYQSMGGMGGKVPKRPTE